jgi:uncharacterized protein (TIGR03790 family)
MKLRLFTLILAAAVPLHGDDPLPAAVPKPRSDADLAAQTVVVFNENDLDSIALAGQYSELRGIPTKNLVGVKCSVAEEITRDDYDRSIAEPLRKIFEQRGWWKLREENTDAGRVENTKIRFVALMRGIPLKISQFASYPGDKSDGEPPEIFTRNSAAVDSELSVLGLWSKQISGVQQNPYYRETKTIAETDLESQLLVCRLDGESAAVVRRMMEDSVAAEKEGLRGFVYVDALGLKEGGLVVGDKWLHEAARDAREHGLPVILDNGPALFPNAYPMRHCALYVGWYSEQVMGALARDGFRLPRGSVAYHIHSFSAVTLRQRGRNWCAPLLEAGAAATLGNVYEPYLGLLPRPDVFTQRLREGFTFAEAAYMSQQYLSWMTTFVGDPLYRPFMNSAQAKPKPENEWDAYRDGVALWLSKGRKAGETALRETAAKMKSGIVSECLGLLELSGNDYAVAVSAFEQARGFYTDTADRVRVAVHEAGAIRAAKGDVAAVKFLRAQAGANPGPHAEVLEQLANGIGSSPQKGPEARPAPEKKPDVKKPDVKKPAPKAKPRGS